MIIEILDRPLVIDNIKYEPGKFAVVPEMIGEDLQMRGLVIDINLVKNIDWFQNWRHETCVVIASGPSAENCNFLRAKDKCKIIAINNSWKLPDLWNFHADVLFGIDYNWWVLNKGVMAFPNLKICTSSAISNNPWKVRYFTIRETITDFRTGGNCLAYGGNSGFSAIHLAILFGCKRIILAGFDMHLKNGIHWHGKHNEDRKLKNPDEFCLARWAAKLDSQRSVLDKLNVEVIDTCLDGALTAFPKISFAELF